MGRREEGIAERLAAPVFNLNHLVKERYPTFIDALRDMDDPYSTLFLFRSVKLHLARSFDARRINDLERLCGEWLSVVSNAKLLRKTFISIKGFYFQAIVKGQQITWLMPHRVMQNTPVDVDYNIMSTFVQFYETMAKFVNFKVAKDEGLDYPLLFGEEAEKKAVETIFGSATAITGSSAAAAKGAKSGKKAAAAVPASSAAAAAADAAEAAAEAAASSSASADDSADTTAFHALDPDALPLVDQAAAKQAAVFKGMTFLVSREVPLEPVAFVIRCGGGIAVGESFITPAQASSDKFTHQIVDRPGLAAFLPSRSYVQPQWVFDSFNEAHALPVEPYAVGAKLPPHLSPFVNDEKAGYVPEQRNVLRRWVGLAPLKDGAQRDLSRQPTEEELAAAREAEDEAEYQAGLKAEVKSTKAASKKEAAAPAAGKKGAAAKKEAEPAPKKGTAAAKAAAQKAAEEAAAEEEEEEEFEFAASDLESGADDDDDDEEGSDVEIDGDVDGVDIEEEDSDSEAEATTIADGEDDDDDDDEEGVNHPKAPRPDTFNARNTERELAKMMVKRRHSYLINEKDRKIKLKAQKAQVLAVKRDAHKAGVENPELPKVHRKRGRH